MAGLSLPTRSALVDDIYAVLKRQIMDRGFAPGSQLVMDQLAKDLKVSVTPLREALARLDAEGLVSKVPMQGYTIRPELTPDELVDLYDYRAATESWAAGRAALRRSDEQLSRLQVNLAASEKLPSGASYESYKGLALLDMEFHRMIIDIAGNRHLAQSFSRANSHLHLFRGAFSLSQVPATIAEHRSIVDAIARRSESDAASAMQQHLRRSSERAVSHLTRAQDA